MTTRPYPSGTFIVEIDVEEGHDIGHGQLGLRVLDALHGGPVSPHPLPFVTVRTSFRLAPNDHGVTR